ncbi:hypothetical protein Plec18170_008285 [Paecilomyces lecythidis]
MPPQRKARSFLQKATENGADQNRQGINGEKVNRKIEPQTEKDYNAAWERWLMFCTAKNKDPEASAYDLESLKDFVHNLAYGIEGKYDDEIAGQGSVKEVWKRFTAGFRRHHDAIPSHITLSVTNFLRETVFPKRGNKKVKRVRKHARKNHFIHLGRQLWENDWYEYSRPMMRVSIWAQMLLYVFSSARQCEYLEGASRANSERGLYCRDMKLGVIRNEIGEPELALQVVKDAKGMSDTPEKRPEHEIYEGLSTKPRHLLLNPMIPILAILLANGRLRDYRTVDEILAIPAPPEDEVYVLEWADPARPLFEGLDGLIQKAAALGRILKDLAERAGYDVNPTMHDFRAEGLYLIGMFYTPRRIVSGQADGYLDKVYSVTQRMVHGGHRSEATHRQSYAPNNGTDGQAAYLGDDVRTHVSDLFRGLALSRNPDLWQSLPAEKRYQLENREDYLELEGALAKLQGSSHAVQKERRTLYNRKRKLIQDELRKCRKEQPRRFLHEEADATYTLGAHRSRFSRACRMMPARRRLAANIFRVATFRSDLGHQVLNDMVSLCRQESEIEVRPGLEPIKCHCIDAKERTLKDRKCRATRKYVTFSFVSAKVIYMLTVAKCRYEPAASKWKHVYQCHKEYLEGIYHFAEFCFRCDEWFTDEHAWEQHCQSHLDSPDPPVQCDPLIYGGTLVHPGFCPFCQRNPTLMPSRRMYQFLNRAPWKEHVSRCFANWVEEPQKISGATGLVFCPHPHPKCAGFSASALELRFHLEDIHCCDFIREAKKRFSDVDSGTEEDSSPRKRCRRWKQQTPAAVASPPTRDFIFVDEKPKTYRLQQRSGGKRRRLNRGGSVSQEYHASDMLPLLSSGNWNLSDTNPESETGLVPFQPDDPFNMGQSLTDEADDRVPLLSEPVVSPTMEWTMRQEVSDFSYPLDPSL